MAPKSKRRAAPLRSVQCESTPNVYREKKIIIMTVCAVKFCHNTSEKQKKCHNITFHRIPLNPVIADKWVKCIRLSRREEYWKPTKSTRICSKHFNNEDKYITNKGLCKLRRNAVPVKDLHISCTVTDNLYVDEVSPFHGLSASSQERTSSHTQGGARKKSIKRLPKAKTIISSVYNYLKTEYENLKMFTAGSCDLSPLEDILKRTAAATGVSEEVVTAVLEGEDSEDSSNEPSRKRARVSSEYCDEDESPAEEVSDGESSDEADEAQPGNEESVTETEEHPIETLKVEIDENDEYHSTPNSGILFQVPFTKEQMSALQGSLLPREPTHTKVKLEPADIEAQQPMEPTHAQVKREPADIEDQQYFQGPDAVLDTGGEQDPLGEPMELTHTEVKREPAHIDDQHTEFPSSSTTLSGRRPD